MTNTKTEPFISYRNVFLVQNRTYWKACPFSYDKEEDLVLTLDFALAREIRKGGGRAEYLDHFVSPEIMERHNKDTYYFFENWYRDKDGRDIFSHRGIDIGNALRLDIWNDVTYFVRIVVNLLAVKNLVHERIFVGLEDSSVVDAIARLGLKFEGWRCETTHLPEYYFPVFRWMKERIRPDRRLKHRLKNMLSWARDRFFLLGDRLHIFRSARVDVFVERYFPTEPVIARLKQDPRLNVVLEHYTWGKCCARERRIPAGKTRAHHRGASAEMWSRFLKNKNLHWQIEGFCVSDALYDIIGKKIETVLPLCLPIVDAIIHFFEKRELKLMVYIANLGLLNCLLLDYCKKHGIPSYFILNGLLLHDFPEEDIRGITWINAYGESIKKDYFAGADNVVCLGDPRLDDYINNFSSKDVNYSEPCILIGAGAFSPIDLNSYTAIEFEFLYDVLAACRILRGKGRKFKIIIKVRSNGYIGQYQDFIREYYSDLPIKIFDTIPFSQVLAQADFYISVYSGTHFEAAALRIPTLYYKNDVEMLIAPYNAKSELVTAFSVEDMVSKMELFYKRDPIYDPFREKKVLEKYVGPLDGKNARRNLDFIYSLCGLEPFPEREGS